MADAVETVIAATGGKMVKLQLKQLDGYHTPAGGHTPAGANKREYRVRALSGLPVANGGLP